MSIDSGPVSIGLYREVLTVRSGRCGVCFEAPANPELMRSCRRCAAKSCKNCFKCWLEQKIFAGEATRLSCFACTESVDNEVVQDIVSERTFVKMGYLISRAENRELADTVSDAAVKIACSYCTTARTRSDLTQAQYQVLNVVLSLGLCASSSRMNPNHAHRLKLKCAKNRERKIGKPSCTSMSILHVSHYKIWRL
jgi:hypothetical protein